MEQFSIDLRPHRFDEILGQERIKQELLKRAHTNKWPKAMLLQGMYGTGKTTTAQIIAMSLQCTHKDSDGNPCGECASCKSIMNETFGRNTIRLDGGVTSGKNSVVEETDVLQVSSMYDPNWVFIVEEADQLSSAAINSFLKLLEHPKKNIYFILLSMKQGGMPAAIQSRCQIFNFKAFSIKDTMLALKHVMEDKGLWEDENIPMEFKTKGLAFLASASKGSLRSALQFLESAIVGEYFDLNSLKDAFYTIDEVATYNILRGLLSLSKDEGMWDSIYRADPSELYNYITLVLSDAMVFKQTGYIKNEMFLSSTKQLASNKNIYELFKLMTTFPALQKPYVRRADLVSSLATFYANQQKENIPVRRLPQK